jgi:ADP-heptose:LPS heptosyltransferase
MYNHEMYESVGRCLLSVHGGIGRNIMATAVIKNIKQKFPHMEINVLAGFPDIFMKNPNIKRIHNLGHPSYVYEDYVKDKKTLIMNVEPYQHYSYIHRERHFIECWCEMINIPCVDLQPQVTFNLAEQEMAKDYLKKFDRQMILFQHQGGKVPEHKTKKDKLISSAGMYKRNLPEHVVQKVVDGLIDMGYMVGSVGHENQFLPRGAEQIKFPIRAIVALIPYVAGVISIDSFLVHGSACFKDQTPTLAIWGGTDPRVLGYHWHKNMMREACDSPMCHRPNSYLHDVNEAGYMWDCPHNDICMSYDPDEILTAFKEMMKEGKDDGIQREGQDQPCGEKEESSHCEECLGNKEPASVGAN